MTGWKIPSPVDTRPSAARIYDYELGGQHNFDADRKAADQIRALVPHAGYVAQSNRAFLRRAVHHLISRGITQFLDLGSGIPTVGNVHEIAEQHTTDPRVVYVDNEPVAVAQTRRLLEDNSTAAIVDGDLREPDSVLGSDAVRRLLRFDEPIGLLVVAALHYVSDADQPAEIVRAYTEALPAGSLLAVSQVTYDDWEWEASVINDFFNSETSSTVIGRSHAEITRIVRAGGWEFVPPGLVHPPEWKPDGSDPAQHAAAQSGSWAGVAARR